MASSNFSSLRNNRKTFLNKLAEEAKKETQKGGPRRRLLEALRRCEDENRLRTSPLPPRTTERRASVGPCFRISSRVRRFMVVGELPDDARRPPCPVCKENNKLWNSGVEDDKTSRAIASASFSSSATSSSLKTRRTRRTTARCSSSNTARRFTTKSRNSSSREFPDSTPANPVRPVGRRRLQAEVT
jgi:hypothetical protein